MADDVVVVEEKVVGTVVSEETVKARTTPREFLVAWQSSNSLQEVADKLDVTIASVVSREKKYRGMLGDKLKVFPKHSRVKKLDAASLNALLEEIKAEQEKNPKKK
jgi:signal recognition particle subunit SEC65